MAIVLSERDYKRVTLFAKIAGIFLFAAGSITIVDNGRPWLGLALVALGTLVTLAPVPMTVVKPDTLDAAEAALRAEMLVVDE